MAAEDRCQSAPLPLTRPVTPRQSLQWSCFLLEPLLPPNKYLSPGQQQQPLCQGLDGTSYEHYPFNPILTSPAFPASPIPPQLKKLRLRGVNAVSRIMQPAMAVGI